MNVPVFIDVSLEEQAVELRSYLKEHGADIDVKASENGIEDDLNSIIGVCDVCFSAIDNEVHLEEMLNGIVSMIASISVEKCDNLILSLCKKLASGANLEHNIVTTRVCFKVIWSLYQSLTEDSMMKYHVYYRLVELSAKIPKMISKVYNGEKWMKTQFQHCNPSVEQMQKLLRLLHTVFLDAKLNESASSVMIELLGTYTADNASEAREEAQRFIVAELADPNTFLLDNLLSLKPVKFLEGELIHDLLKIFVSEKLETYVRFYEGHREFVDSIGLKHELNIQKMKMLTFMQMAESNSEISFGDIQMSLQLEADDVEEFLIELLKTKLVRAKIDSHKKVIHVSSSMNRTFTTQHWHSLHSLLVSWKDHLNVIKDQMSQLSSAQMELVHQKQSQPIHHISLKI